MAHPLWESKCGIIAAHLWFPIPFLFDLFLSFEEIVSFSIDAASCRIKSSNSMFRNVYYAVWNALTKCDQFQTIYVDLNSHWIIDDSFSRYIYSTIKNWNSYTIRIYIHSWGMWLAQYQFTNSWISLNLATISIYRENKIYWWRAVGRIENLGSFFLSLVEMMAIFRVMRVKHTVASFYISRARFMCMRTQRKYVNKNTSWISSQCFNSAIDFLILDIYIVVEFSGYGMWKCIWWYTSDFFPLSNDGTHHLKRISRMTIGNISRSNHWLILKLNRSMQCTWLALCVCVSLAELYLRHYCDRCFAYEPSQFSDQKYGGKMRLWMWHQNHKMNEKAS